MCSPILQKALWKWQGKPSIKKEVTYYKEVIDGEVVAEVDKFNGKAIIGGVDQTKDILDCI